MPILPENRARYPANWTEIRLSILRRAGYRCEGSPAYPKCRARNQQPHPVTGVIVALGVGHIDHTPEHNDPSNLRAWCARCHNAHDQAHRIANRRARAHARRAARDLFAGTEHAPEPVDAS